MCGASRAPLELITTPVPSRIARLWPWAAAVLSGVLLALSFAPANQAWLIWIALAPLLCAIWFTSAKKPRPFLLGYVAGLVFYVGAFHWLSSLGALFQAPLLKGIPLLLSLYLGLYIGFWAMFLRGLAPSMKIDSASSLRHLGIGALGASAMVALEWTRGWFLTGFGWDGLGVALYRNLPMIQIADLTGVLGLTWLITFVNVMAVVIVRRLLAELGPQFLKRVRWEFSGTMLVIALVFSYGARTLLHPAAGPVTPIRVATIQPNVPQDVKFDENSEDAILDKLKTLTVRTTLFDPPPHVILWPEAPAVRGMLADQTNYDLVMNLAQQASSDLLIGSLDYEPAPGESDQLYVYNAAYLLSENGRRRDIYRKMHLVPFGEYMPLRKLMPAAINNLVSSDLKAGREPVVFHLAEAGLPVAPLICFEDTLGDLTRRSCLAGAQLLVNLTNDGWFQHTVGAEQHLANATLRAVENRRPLVRSTNTGFTGLVDTLGRWQPWIDPFTENVAIGQIAVPTGDVRTFYTRYGDWIAWLSSGVALLSLAWRAVLRQRTPATEGLRLDSPSAQ